MDNATDYRDMAADMPLAIVIGSEGQGMSRLVKDKCDFYINLRLDDVYDILHTSLN
jgi:23S rRNA (guanosine2251-2'-O)-methyltransferase